MTEAQRRAQKKYHQKKYQYITIALDKEKDFDVIYQLALYESPKEYIRDLIRDDIRRANANYV